MSATLRDCDDLFLQYFDRWYDDSARIRKGFRATRPDMLQLDSLIGASPREASSLAEESQQQALGRIATMVEAARTDWPRYLPVSGALDLDWIDAFDKFYDENRIGEVIQRSDPTDFDNDYVLLCCEFGAALGHVMRAMQSRLVWCAESPYWESPLLDPRTGNLMPVFHWAIKKMSNYGVRDGFARKLKACLQVLA